MEKLYLTSGGYSASLVIMELWNIIRERGGKVVSEYGDNRKPAEIHNRDTEEKHISWFASWDSSYITFFLDGYIYYLQIDGNLFFPAKYQKKRAGNGNKVYLEEMPRQYVNYGMTKDEAKEAAAKLFSFLESAECSEVFMSEKVIIVLNTYNDGWHEEAISKPEKALPYKEVELIGWEELTK